METSTFGVVCRGLLVHSLKFGSLILMWKVMSVFNLPLLNSNFTSFFFRGELEFAALKDLRNFILYSQRLIFIILHVQCIRSITMWPFNFKELGSQNKSRWYCSITASDKNWFPIFFYLDYFLLSYIYFTASDSLRFHCKNDVSCF